MQEGIHSRLQTLNKRHLAGQDTPRHTHKVTEKATEKAREKDTDKRHGESNRENTRRKQRARAEKGGGKLPASPPTTSSTRPLSHHSMPLRYRRGVPAWGCRVAAACVMKDTQQLTRAKDCGTGVGLPRRRLLRPNQTSISKASRVPYLSSRAVPAWGCLVAAAYTPRPTPPPPPFSPTPCPATCRGPSAPHGGSAGLAAAASSPSPPHASRCRCRPRRHSCHEQRTGRRTTRRLPSLCARNLRLRRQLMR